MHIGFPFRLGSTGRIAGVSEAAHIRDLIQQVIFTVPGERVMRPEFGSGVSHLVFEPGGSDLAQTTEYAVRGALQRYLGDLISIHAIQVRTEESTVRIVIQYALVNEPPGEGGGGLRTEIFEDDL